MSNFPNQEKVTKQEIMEKMKDWRDILRTQARQTANAAYWNEADERAHKVIYAFLEEIRNVSEVAENLLCSALERDAWIQAASRFIEKIRDFGEEAAHD